MALTRAQYATQALGALRQALATNPEALAALLPGFVVYGKLGSAQLEGVETLLNYFWKTVRGKAYDGHGMRHLLLSADIPASDTRDVPNLTEP